MNEKTAGKPKKNRFLIIFVCIFLAALLAFGGVFGIIRIVKERNSVAKYDGIYLDEGAARYLAAYYKNIYISLLNGEGVDAFDNKELFWDTEAEDGKTYGEELAESFGEYLCTLLVAVSLYDSIASYTAADEREVERRAEIVLNDVAGGSVARYNEIAALYGFSYDDFLSASEYLYKESTVQRLLYGADGSGISADSDACARYLETYSHVSVIYISLDRMYMKDDSDNFIYDDEGNPKSRELTADEKAERVATVDKLRRYITGEGGEYMTTDTFKYYLERSDSVPAEKYGQNYYFNRSSVTTAGYAEHFAEVVEASYEMEIGEYRAVEAPEIGGVCFIYKYSPAKGAYLDKENVFFADFYEDAADYTYISVLSELSRDVTLTDSFYEMDIVGDFKKMRYDFIVSAW